MGDSQKYDIDQIRSGNEILFEQIFKSYFERICCFVHEYIIDWEGSKELAQETFVRFWEAREGLEDHSDISALLFRIARNLALNYLKHRTVVLRYQKQTEQHYLESQLNLTALMDMQVDRIFRGDLHDELHHAIAELPERCREVFLMSRNFGMSYREIATRLDISERTVENHISEALRKLRQRFRIDD